MVQVLNSHMQLVATVLGSKVLECFSYEVDQEKPETDNNS